MKLRIQGNSLRLRLTRSEVTTLHQNGVIEESAQFSSGSRLRYRIQTGGSDIRADLNTDTITVCLPHAAMQRWATSDAVGLNARDGGLRIAIEKDFRCLTRPREQNAPDAYPHPLARQKVS
jgi:hypothetical protein